MTTIGSVSDLTSLISQFSTSSVSNRSCDSDATSTSQGIAGTGSTPPPGGGLMDAIMQALSSAGVSLDGSTSSDGSSSTSGSTASSSTSDSNTQQALQSFMQSLFAALHAQSAGGLSQSDSSNSDSGSTTGTTSIAGGGGRPDPASDLNSLIQELTASQSQSTTTSSSSDSTSTGSSTAGSALTSLEQSFQNLVSATGGKDGSTTALNSFLSALANDMSEASSTGNFVNTHA